jgi:hypothetical protein
VRKGAVCRGQKLSCSLALKASKARIRIYRARLLKEERLNEVTVVQESTLHCLVEDQKEQPVRIIFLSNL